MIAVGSIMFCVVVSMVPSLPSPTLPRWRGRGNIAASVEHQHRARDLAGLHRAEGFVDVAETAAPVTIASRSSRPWR